MKILMISLDKNILDSQSSVAGRMKEYGRKDELFIIIPARQNINFSLSPSVHIYAVGGNKLSQFFQINKLGQKIIKENGVDLITTQDPFFTGLIGVFLKKETGVKLEVQIHGDFFGSKYYSAMRRRLGRYVTGQAGHLRVVGERIRRSLLKLGVANGKINIKPIKVDGEAIHHYQPKFDLRDKYPGYEKIFLVLGRLEPVKNIAWLIDVFEEVVRQKHNWMLLIVGSGKEESKIKLQVTRLSARQVSYRLQDNIKFEGWTDDPISYLKTADCLLFPSLSEGYGLVVMEAAAAGIPVIMSDVGVAGYELKQGPKVKILSVNDREEFKRAVLSI